MKYSRVVNRFRERGAVAVEAAISFAVLAVIVTAPTLFLAFYFYQYTTAQKAAHDAALYLSMAPRGEMITVGPEGGPAALTLAKRLIAKEMAGISSPIAPVDPSIVCGYQQNPTSIGWKTCSTTNNQQLVTVAVSIDMNFVDPLTGYDSGLMISAYVPMPYVGN